MFLQLHDSRLELVTGDITLQQVDAIVNAANSELVIGGGVDRAIHAAGGPAIHADLVARVPQGCPTGSAVSSTAGKLSARRVFHAVGPVWRGGSSDESQQLASAYRAALELALAEHCDSLAFPALSTGVYGYPRDLAAEIALGTTLDFLRTHRRPRLVRFVLFDAGAYGAFARTLDQLRPMFLDS